MFQNLGYRQGRPCQLLGDSFYNNNGLRGRSVRLHADNGGWVGGEGAWTTNPPTL